MKTIITQDCVCERPSVGKKILSPRAFSVLYRNVTLVSFVPMMTSRALLVLPLLAGLLLSSTKSAAGEAWSGLYPHLAFFNEESECGTGAVVPWAGRLWALTYAPHKPRGSSDKLYEITPELELIIRPESIGGTPANRMIHRESEQLFMGP